MNRLKKLTIIMMTTTTIWVAEWVAECRAWVEWVAECRAWAEWVAECRVWVECRA
jgi:hypothetical protein